MKKMLLITLEVLSIYGCAMQSDMMDLENELRRMKGIVIENQRDVTRLQKSQQVTQQEIQNRPIRDKSAEPGGDSKEMLDILQKNQANFEVRFDQLSTDVQGMQGKVEETNHRLSELSNGIDDHEMAFQELSKKVDSIEVSMREAQRGSDKIILPGKDIGSGKTVKPVKPDTSTNPALPPLPTPPPMPAPVPQPAAQGSPAPSAEGTAASPIPPSDLYNQAYKDYMLGNYDLAITGFSDYLRQSPTGNLAPNALYWIGECYYSKGNYTKAITVFDSVTIDYPKSNKVVSALLKIGYSYEKAGDKEMSVTYFKKVIEQFPYSDEAKLAKVKLSEMK